MIDGHRILPNEGDWVAVLCGFPPQEHSAVEVVAWLYEKTSADSIHVQPLVQKPFGGLKPLNGPGVQLVRRTDRGIWCPLHRIAVREPGDED